MSSNDGDVATSTNRRLGGWLGTTILVVFVGSVLESIADDTTLSRAFLTGEQ